MLALVKKIQAENEGLIRKESKDSSKNRDLKNKEEKKYSVILIVNLLMEWPWIYGIIWHLCFSVQQSRTQAPRIWSCWSFKEGWDHEYKIPLEILVIFIFLMTLSKPHSLLIGLLKIYSLIAFSIFRVIQPSLLLIDKIFIIQNITPLLLPFPFSHIQPYCHKSRQSLIFFLFPEYQL